MLNRPLSHENYIVVLKRYTNDVEERDYKVTRLPLELILLSYLFQRRPHPSLLRRPEQNHMLLELFLG